MGRAGVAYSDIQQAADAISQSGTEPTVDKVREYLGTGSKSTIAPLLKRWRQQREESTASDGLPVELVQALKSVHAHTQGLADKKVAQIEADTQQQLTAMQQQLAQVVALQQQTETEKAHTDERVERLKTERKQVSQALEQKSLKLVKSDATLDEARQQLVECRATITELRQESRDIREHFEHYQQQIASDRQQERDQFQFSRQQLESRQMDLQQQLAAVQASYHQLITLNTSQAQQLEQQTQQADTLKQSLNEEIQAHRETDIHLQHSRTGLAQLQQQCKDILESLDASRQQLTEQQNEQQRLNGLLESATQAVVNSNAERERLAADNRQLAEAGATSLGRIRQLEIQLAGIEPNRQ